MQRARQIERAGLPGRRASIVSLHYNPWITVGCQAKSVENFCGRASGSGTDGNDPLTVTALEEWDFLRMNRFVPSLPQGLPIHHVSGVKWATLSGLMIFFSILSRVASRCPATLRFVGKPLRGCNAPMNAGSQSRRFSGLFNTFGGLEENAPPHERKSLP